jgi:hypothetical protein
MLISAFLAFAFNFGFISKQIIGDECKYDVDNVQPSKLFEVFYTISSETGYHPEPSNFNFAFTILIGLSFGFLVSFVFFRTKHKKQLKTARFCGLVFRIFFGGGLLCR